MEKVMIKKIEQRVKNICECDLDWLFEDVLENKDIIFIYISKENYKKVEKGLFEPSYIEYMWWGGYDPFDKIELLAVYEATKKELLEHINYLNLETTIKEYEKREEAKRIKEYEKYQKLHFEMFGDVSFSDGEKMDNLKNL